MAGIKKYVQNVYNDPFKWSLIKSVGLFAIGIKIALEFRGMELMGPPPVL